MNKHIINGGIMNKVLILLAFTFLYISSFSQNLTTTIPLDILKLNYGFHMIVNIKINGKKARMLIDTGASSSVLDETQITKYKHGKYISIDDKSIGLGTNDADTKMTCIDTIEIGELKIKNDSISILDLSMVNKAYEELNIEPLTGVIGMDLLIKYNAVIDIEKKELTLEYE